MKHRIYPRIVTGNETAYNEVINGEILWVNHDNVEPKYVELFKRVNGKLVSITHPNNNGTSFINLDDIEENRPEVLNEVLSKLDEIDNTDNNTNKGILD